ncbi:MAG: hypothetical protein OEU91_07610 [Gammaproteobacteria bacterium]|nr:hypothetical protein [Gammaproteobacteria bacterium]
MDCYIVRVYRHISQGDGEADEIAGLVEHVGHRDGNKPFSSYQSLVSALREDSKGDVSDSADVDDGGSETAARLRVVHTAKHG